MYWRFLNFFLFQMFEYIGGFFRSERNQKNRRFLESCNLILSVTHYLPPILAKPVAKQIGNRFGIFVNKFFNHSSGLGLSLEIDVF